MNIIEKQPALLTAEQIMDEIQISRVTLWRWTKKGKIPHYKIGGNIRYLLHEVLDATKVNK